MTIDVDFIGGGGTFLYAPYGASKSVSRNVGISSIAYNTMVRFIDPMNTTKLVNDVDLKRQNNNYKYL